MSAAKTPTIAMVLAAGLGTRMRPITDHTPKPLVEVGGQTMLDRALDHLAHAGVGRAVVNLHHLADCVTNHLSQRAAGPEITYSDERAELLETGGGLALARPLLGDDPIFALNADMIWLDGPEGSTLSRMAQAWDPAQMDALLLLVPVAQAHGYDGKGDFIPDAPLPHSKAQQIVRRPNKDQGEPAPVMFGGVQILKPELFDGEPIEPWSLNRLYNRLLEQKRLFGIVHTGSWFHVGTPDAIAPTTALIAAGRDTTLG